MAECKIPDCSKPARQCGLCYMHYGRYRRHGSTDYEPSPRATVSERFWAKVDKDGLGDCWMWTGVTTIRGRGNFWSGKNWIAPTRFCYQELTGSTPPTRYSIPTCGQPLCVKPDHIEWVTPADAIRSAWERLGYKPVRKTHCRYGHDLVDAWKGTRRGGGLLRLCRECGRRRSRENYARKKQTQI